MYSFDFYYEMHPLLNLSPVLKGLENEINSIIKYAFIFGGQNEEVIIVTHDDTVYVIGQNNNGCLGLGHTNPVKSPTKNQSLSNKNIIKIIKSSSDSFHCLTADGQLYGWGENKFGEIGDGTTEDILIPKLITGHLDKKFVDLKCCVYTSMALSEDGQVFMWGSNLFGQLGDGSTQDSLSPKRVTTGIGDEVIASIFCTGNSSYAVLENGHIYGWGFNEFGQLCLGHFEKSISVPTPINILNNFRIKKISFGAVHILMLDEEGKLYSWGYNDAGQLGIGHRDHKNTIQPIKTQNKVIDILAFNCTSYCLMDNEDVYVFGLFNEEDIKEPRKTELKFSQVMMETSKEFGATFNWRQC